MRVFRCVDSIGTGFQKPVVTIGNFDGVHVAHQELINTAKNLAAEHHGDVVILTFWPHPSKVLASGKAVALLQTLEQRLESIARFGVAAVIVEQFDKVLAALTPEQFVATKLVGQLRTCALVVGDDFRFGVRRSGNTEMLRELTTKYGIDLTFVAPRMIDGERISSSSIRRLVKSGDVSRVQQFLGRPFETVGRVIHGDHRGRQLGWPTANILSATELTPKAGIYAGRASVDGHWFAAAISLGVRPMFQFDGVKLEAHLLDFSGDLYGKELVIQWLSFLREEARFGSLEALKAAIAADVSSTRTLVGPYHAG